MGRKRFLSNDEPRMLEHKTWTTVVMCITLALAIVVSVWCDIELLYSAIGQLLWIFSG